MNHLRNVFRGFGIVVNPLGFRRAYLKPANGGFRRDVASLAADWSVVGAGLKANSETALGRYDKPSNYVTGQEGG